MITKLTGPLLNLSDEWATIAVPPFEYQVLIPDFSRRRLQSQVGQEVTLHTLHFLDGNVAQGGRLTPRLVGFVSEIEREFFELFCSVDGLGVRKALRAMVRPVQDVANAIEQQDSKLLSTLPGIGPATADRVIAKLKRRMPKFALLVTSYEAAGEKIERDDVVEETYQVLLSLGHSESDARKLLEAAIQTGEKFKDVEALLHAVYRQAQQ